MKKTILLAAILIIGATTMPLAANYEEANVPDYTLPDPLVCLDGTPVKDAKTWEEKRRPEILDLFETYVYGKTPAAPTGKNFTVENLDRKALGGKAIRKEALVPLADTPDAPCMRILIHSPADAKSPVPVFLGLNFNGNHATTDDPSVTLTDKWVYGKGDGVDKNRATEASRGTSAGRWPVEQILARGYAVATIHSSDIDPDFDDGFKNGIHALYAKDAKTPPAPDEWGSISAWAFGLSRALDYIETDPALDGKRVALIGHSRLGKTALWGGARDRRFALVISNMSGCGGAALSRRAYGETVERINTSFPHWFNGNFKKYNDNEAACPVDQHMLIALIAPRPTLVCSAEDDRWADPRGEFLAAHGAAPVFRLLGATGPKSDKMPGMNEFDPTTVSYHIRPGKHSVTPEDWRVYCDFADKYLKR